MRTHWQLFFRFFASSRLVFWLLPPLMVLLVLGTVAQRYTGLYEAEKLFFSSWVVWLGPVPIPSTYSLLLALAMGLIANLLFERQWSLSQFGIILTHLGALSLLAGGLITAISAEEGYLVLAEGESGQFVSDYHQRQLVITRNEEEPVAAIPYQQLQTGSQHSPQGLPFSFTVKHYHRNSEPIIREEVTEAHQAIAQKMDLKPLPLNKQDEANQHGIIIEVSEAGEAQNGIYLAYEMVPMPILIRDEEGNEFRMRLQKARRELPFAVTLKHFEKYSYPGSDMAKDYESLVTISEGEGVSWDQAIRMNEPLRAEGYTLYQSSFIKTTEGKELSVLAVVKNEGYWFPYLASILMGIGLLWHSLRRYHKGQGEG